MNRFADGHAGNEKERDEFIAAKQIKAHNI